MVEVSSVFTLSWSARLDGVSVMRDGAARHIVSEVLDYCAMEIIVKNDRKQVSHSQLASGLVRTFIPEGFSMASYRRTYVDE